MALSGKPTIELLSELHQERWLIEDFFNFDGAMGFDRASTFNLNIRYGKMSLALLAQAATYELRKSCLNHTTDGIQLIWQMQYLQKWMEI